MASIAMGSVHIRVAVVVLIILAAGIGGYALAARQSSPYAVDRGMASSGEGDISARADGWTYKIPIDIRWVSTTNVWHDGGRPDCLPPSGALLPVTFGAVDNTSLTGTRPVVWVQC